MKFVDALTRGLLLAGIFSVALPAFAQNTTPFVFTHDLRPGSTSADVQELQHYLNTHGAVVTTTGPGSPGNETPYFGQLTKQALAHFQELHAVDILTPLNLTRGTGYLLASTRTFLNHAPQVPVPPVTTTPAVRPSLAPVSLTSENIRITPIHHRQSLASQTYTIGGTISGLSDMLMLQNNGGDLLTTSTNGSFTFSSSVANLLSYVVTIFDEPGNQICLLSNGAGTVASANVTSVGVTCYTIPSISSFPNTTVFFVFATRAYTLPTPTSSSSGAFTYSSSNTSVATVSGNVATLVGIGTTTITALQATSSPYASRSVFMRLQAYVDECYAAPCENGGTCTNVPPTDFSCSCPTGYSGTLCELSTANCDGSGSNFCLNGGTCTASITGGECACTVDFTGQFCDLPAP